MSNYFGVICLKEADPCRRKQVEFKDIIVKKENLDGFANITNEGNNCKNLKKVGVIESWRF